MGNWKSFVSTAQCLVRFWGKIIFRVDDARGIKIPGYCQRDKFGIRRMHDVDREDSDNFYLSEVNITKRAKYHFLE